MLLKNAQNYLILTIIKIKKMIYYSTIITQLYIGIEYNQHNEYGRVLSSGGMLMYSNYFYF